jgi:hypothetical protein
MEDSPNLNALRSRVSGHTWQAYISAVRQDAAFYGFVAAYWLLVLLTATTFGVAHKFAPLTYAGMLAGGLTAPLAVLLAGMCLWSLHLPAPAKGLRASLRRWAVAPETMAGLLLFAAMLIFMGVFLSAKTMLTDIVPFFADPYLANLDFALHGADPWHYALLLVPAGLTRTLEALYFGVWALLLPASMLAALWMPKLRPVRSRYLWSMLIVWTLLGNVLAAALMSAGPVFFSKVAGDPRFDTLVAFLTQNSSGHGWPYFYLWKSHLSGNVDAGAAISAFPSMHLANATMFVLLAGHIHKGLKWAAIVYCAIVLFGSVFLGWHYAVDGYFAIAATIAIWKLVGIALKRKLPEVQPVRVIATW